MINDTQGEILTTLFVFIPIIMVVTILSLILKILTSEFPLIRKKEKRTNLIATEKREEENKIYWINRLSEDYIYCEYCGKDFKKKRKLIRHIKKCLIIKEKNSNFVKYMSDITDNFDKYMSDIT